MALVPPEYFSQDIQSRDTSLVPFVRIGTHDPSMYSEEYLCVSTGNVTLNTSQAGVHFWTALPLLLNITKCSTG